MQLPCDVHSGSKPSETSTLLPGPMKAYTLSHDVENEYLSEAEYLEQEALEREHSDEINNERKRRNNIVIGIIVLCTTLMLVVSTQYGDFLSEVTNGQFFQQTSSIASAVGISSTPHSNSVSSASSSSSGYTTANTLLFTMARDGYNTLPYFSTSPSEIFKYAILDDYDGIIEPHAANSLALLDENSATDTGVYFLYSICPEDSPSSSSCYQGAYSLSGDGPGTVSVTPACSPYDVLTITITAYETTTGTLRYTSQGTLLCLYVRRELRSLSSNDLAKTMDAMFVMWSTTDDDGKEMYGDNYQSARYLLEYHFFSASWQDAGKRYPYSNPSPYFYSDNNSHFRPFYLSRPYSRGVRLLSSAHEAILDLRNCHAGRRSISNPTLLGLHHRVRIEHEYFPLFSIY